MNLAAALLAIVVAGDVIVPSGWAIRATSTVVTTGTMPQGMSASPDGTTIAVVESGYNPPALSLYRANDLQRLAGIALTGAFGRPVWSDAHHVLVAGANADVLFRIDVTTHALEQAKFPKGSHPIAVAPMPGGGYAVATDGDGALRVGSFRGVGAAKAIAAGLTAGGLAVSSDGKTAFVSIRSGSSVAAIDVRTGAVRKIAAGLHPSALLVRGSRLYVAETDADRIGIFDTASLRPIAQVFVGDGDVGAHVSGVSPNALSSAGDRLLVSLGAGNEIAIVRNGRVAGRAPAGRYPTDVLALHGRLYVLDGKGEGSQPNPQYRPGAKGDNGYIGAIEFGSLRAYPMPADGGNGNPQGAAGWNATVADTPVRANGPIQHVIFILKENRSYDQVLGDAPGGNGDASLAWYGRKVTPNQHALAAQYGLFDNTYTSGEVSAAGHMWTDAAFANDYLERTWPASYGGRRDDDPSDTAAGLPGAGYLWDAASRANVSFRDYGELIDSGKTAGMPGIAGVPSLVGRFDPAYVGWDLDYSDLDRAKEWTREFNAFVAANTLPRFEFVYLPNDHTYGSKAGKPAPAAYVATNDLALGKMIETISHSKVWASSAVFVIEDDAQDGPDHVSDQRTTFYLASPYASGGLRHERYSTVSVLRTMEIMLGIAPLSTYDAMAVPMYAAFTSQPHAGSFTALPATVDTTRLNVKTAYGAATSAMLDFSRPDAIPGAVMRDILSKNRL